MMESNIAVTHTTLRERCLVDDVGREQGCGKTDTGSIRIEHEEEALQENVAQDEVDTSQCTTFQANVNFVDNEVDQSVATVNKGIAVTRPDLGVRCESVGIL